MDNKYLTAYRQLKSDYPAAYTALAILPVSGQMAAIADYADAIDRGSSTDAAMAAASLIPGVKLAKIGSKLAPPSIRLASQMNDVEKAISPIVKRAPMIGKGASAEQVAEYIVPTAKASTPDDERKAYVDAWNSQEHESFKAK